MKIFFKLRKSNRFHTRNKSTHPEDQKKIYMGSGSDHYIVGVTIKLNIQLDRFGKICGKTRNECLHKKVFKISRTSTRECPIAPQHTNKI